MNKEKLIKDMTNWVSSRENYIDYKTRSESVDAFMRGKLEYVNKFDKNLKYIILVPNQVNKYFLIQYKMGNKTIMGEGYEYHFAKRNFISELKKAI